MAESSSQQPEPTPPLVSAWAATRPTKKIPESYIALREKYALYTKGNEFFTIPEALEDVRRRLIGVGREAIEEALKGLQIRPKSSPGRPMHYGRYW